MTHKATGPSSLWNLSLPRCFFLLSRFFFCELQGGQGSSLYRWWAHWFGVLRQEPELAFDHGNWRVIPPMPSPFPRTMMINNPSIWPAVSWSKRGIAGVWKRLKEPFGEWRRLFCSKPIILYARHFWGTWGLVVLLIFETLNGLRGGLQHQSDFEFGNWYEIEIPDELHWNYPLWN